MRMANDDDDGSVMTWLDSRFGRPGVGARESNGEARLAGGFNVREESILGSLVSESSLSLKSRDILSLYLKASQMSGVMGRGLIPFGTR